MLFLRMEWVLSFCVVGEGEWFFRHNHNAQSAEQLFEIQTEKYYWNNATHKWSSALIDADWYYLLRYFVCNTQVRRLCANRWKIVSQHPIRETTEENRQNIRLCLCVWGYVTTYDDLVEFCLGVCARKFVPCATREVLARTCWSFNLVFPNHSVCCKKYGGDLLDISPGESFLNLREARELLESIPASRWRHCVNKQGELKPAALSNSVDFLEIFSGCGHLTSGGTRRKKKIGISRFQHLIDPSQIQIFRALKGPGGMHPFKHGWSLQTSPFNRIEDFNPHHFFGFFIFWESENKKSPLGSSTCVPNFEGSLKANPNWNSSSNGRRRRER